MPEQVVEELLNNKMKTIKSAAEFSCDVLVTINGRFLIEHGIAEKWLRMRGAALRKNKAIKKHGKVTEEFTDTVTIVQARALGIIH